MVRIEQTFLHFCPQKFSGEDVLCKGRLLAAIIMLKIEMDNFQETLKTKMLLLQSTRPTTDTKHFLLSLVINMGFYLLILFFPVPIKF